MKRAALGLAAMGILCLAANRASAQSFVSPSAAIRVTAGHGIPRTSDPESGYKFQQVGFYEPAYPGYPAYPRYHRGPGPVFVPPRAWHHPAVVIPLPRYRLVAPPPIYLGPSYYYGPSRGFSYQSPGFSFGFSF